MPRRARVIKREVPADPRFGSRTLTRFMNKLMFSGKKSLAMNLRKEPAKEILRELIKVSDVIVQNFRPGTMAKMGFGWDVIQQLNPRMIMANVSAYGQFGPYSEKIGYDPIGQAVSGIMMTTGWEGLPPLSEEKQAALWLVAWSLNGRRGR